MVSKKDNSSVFIAHNIRTKNDIKTAESQEQVRKSTNLLKLLSQGLADIKNKNYVSQDDFFNSIEKRIDSLS